MDNNNQVLHLITICLVLLFGGAWYSATDGLLFGIIAFFISLYHLVISLFKLFYDLLVFLMDLADGIFKNVMIYLDKGGR